jgi:Domain of unknown function (DUF5666)
MRPRTLLFAAIAALLALPALAQTPPAGPPTRIRGTVEALDGQMLMVKSRDGQSLHVMLAPDYKVNGLAKADLASIKANDFVGVAAKKGPDGKLQAQEVLVFPEAMRGTGEGHYPWDLTPDSTMTNATVAEVASAPKGRVLKLKHKDGENEIEVAPDAPVVTFVPADPSLLKPGAAVFLIAQKKPDGTFTAARVNAEKDGVKPPM